MFPPNGRSQSRNRSYSVSSSGSTPNASLTSSKSNKNTSFNRSISSPEQRNNNFKVVIRVRPPLPRELSGEIEFQNVVAVDEKEQMITISENIDAVIDEHGQIIPNPGPYGIHNFFFDHVYDQYSSQKKVFETTARGVVDSALQGYNATIFAYGQTGTGKTFTMEGFNKDGNIENRGIIPRAIEQIFGHIQRNASPRMRFLVRASYLQIYNEQISDLLKPERSNLTIREDKRRGVFVDGLSEWVVRSPAEIYGLMERGGAVRATGETKMNEASSRSHAVFIVIAEQSETVYVDDNGNEMSPEDFQKFMHARGVHRGQEINKLEDHIRQSFKVGKLNLVDLAGSERVRLSGASGQRLEETKKINQSLSALGNVIAALTEVNGRQHIPYRDSKLTRMLEDSLGGNCRTTMMAMISPALEAMVESLSTLKFANRAKSIRNEAKVNEDLDQKSLLRKYERELKKLRAELEERNKNVVDKRRLLELDEQRKRAEADKMAAIKALEIRSKEFIQEKEEKKKLEQRIAMLMNQMIRGDKNGAIGNGSPGNNNDVDAPEIQNMMKEQQEKLRKEYEYKLADLERERETIEEEKAQVDRYKQLLLKQRDIMIALTQRLVERDEQIMALQDELDAYDRHQRELEEKLDEKTAQLITLQRITMEQVESNSPNKSEELARIFETWGNNNQSNKDRYNNDNTNNEIFQSNADDDESNIVNSNISNNNRLNNSISAISQNNNNKDQLQSLVKQELEYQLRFLNSDPSLRNLSDPLVSIVNNVFSKLPNGYGNDVKSNNLKHINANTELVNQLKAENEELSNKLKHLQNAADIPQHQIALLQTRCDTLVKEREAVQTIMEQKIKVLVQSVAQATTAVVSSTAANGVTNNSQFNSSNVVQTLSKDVAALQRLVNASIAALRNAANQQNNHNKVNSSISMTASVSSSYPDDQITRNKPISSSDYMSGLHR
eukprot:gene16848-22333_t